MEPKTDRHQALCLIRELQPPQRRIAPAPRRGFKATYNSYRRAGHSVIASLRVAIRNHLRKIQ